MIAPRADAFLFLAAAFYISIQQVTRPSMLVLLQMPKGTGLYPNQGIEPKQNVAVVQAVHKSSSVQSTKQDWFVGTGAGCRIS